MGKEHAMMTRLRILRGRAEGKNRWQEYSVEVATDAYVLDALEAAGLQDGTLAFRHACHHASCGSCAVRINGREQMPCIVRVRDAGPADGVIRLEPLRNFSRIADLVVDRVPMLDAMVIAGMPLLRAADSGQPDGEFEELRQFENCIECGICVSACPISGSDAGYIGPAALAAAERVLAEPRSPTVMIGHARAGELWNPQPRTANPGAVRDWVNTRHGVWRCHGVFACREACPMDVDPAAAIMRLRTLSLGGSPLPSGRKRAATG
jgi:succinate dehydrogenase / fumarate reductase, iron-sulfur subunit